VENALHWVLDVTFREDDSRVRDRTAPSGVIPRAPHAEPSAPPPATWRCCVRLRLTSSAKIGQPKPACAASGRRQPGTTPTCLSDDVSAISGKDRVLPARCELAGSGRGRVEYMLAVMGRA